jgi:SRSO17 transposase
MSAPRAPVTTMNFVDQYGTRYQDLFPDVRRCDHCKWRPLGLIAAMPRQSLPAIAKAAGLPNGQSLHPCLSDSPGDSEAFRHRRLSIRKQA